MNTNVRVKLKFTRNMLEKEHQDQEAANAIVANRKIHLCNAKKVMIQGERNVCIQKEVMIQEDRIQYLPTFATKTGRTDNKSLKYFFFTNHWQLIILSTPKINTAN
uniref:Uncharacterized protein n=1 Tax=Cacopsylla melanoneura TaxID=428564 RepID=A0A8D9E9X6_9HEMI